MPILADMKIADLRFSSYVSILKKNANLVLIVSLASCLASFLGAEMLIKGVYWSEAEIQVRYGTNTPVGSRNLDNSVVLVRQRLQQDFLEKVIVDHDLYPQERRNGFIDSALKAMEQHILISGVGGDVVRLAYQASDPELAQKVARLLVSQYGGSVSRAQTEDQAMRALQDEIKKAEADLAKQEENVKDFNLRFLGSHLEKQTAMLAALNRLILQLQSNADLLNALQEQKSSQEKFLTQQEGDHPSNSSDGPADSRVPAPLQADDSAIQASASNLTVSELQSKTDQLKIEINQRRRQQMEIRKEMALYQTRIDSAPRVRALQSAIVRDYENSRQHYQELLAKKNEKEMADAAKKASEPSFEILSPASFPDTPSNSHNQSMARLSGLLWGPVVAIALIILHSRNREQKPSLSQVISQSGLPVLASIPWIPSARAHSSEKVPDRASQQSSTQLDR